MQMDLINEESLLDRFQQTKDPIHFKRLMRLFQNRLYNMAYRIIGNAEEAEEIVQDTCVKIYQSLDRFNKNSSLAAWIFRIAHNSCLDALRIKQRKKALKLVTFDPQEPSGAHGSAEGGLIVSQAADPGPGPAEMLDSGEEGAVIAEKLSQLPHSQRAVVVLHDIEGFSYGEIAEITGEKVGTVRSRLHYGRLKMKELLEPYYSAKAVSQVSR